MQLTREHIINAITTNEVEIQPYSQEVNLKGNFLELHLARRLIRLTDLDMFDCKGKQEINNLDYTEITIPDKGYRLIPNTLYLGVTYEWTSFPKLQSQLHGKSSLGRLGLQVHITAGLGNAGFRGHWPLELLCPHALWIYSGMPIAQVELRKFSPEYAPEPYPGGYNNIRQADPRPGLSQYHLKAQTADWLTLPPVE